MIGKTYLALGVFIIIMLVYLVVVAIQKSKKTMTEKLLEKKFEEDDDLVKPNQPEIKKGFIGKIERDLVDAQLNMDARVFIMIIIVFTIILYIGAFYILASPLYRLHPYLFLFTSFQRCFWIIKRKKRWKNLNRNWFKYLGECLLC